MIGIFDSGIGGLTVVRELHRQMPGYDFVYFGDTARLPYGNKSKELVGELSVQDAQFLIAQGAEIIVAACNTASSLGMEALRQQIKVPIFEVVTPAVVAAAAASQGKIGVIGTRGTIASGIHEREIKCRVPEVEVSAAECPLFVPLVEEDWLNTEETTLIAKKYLSPLKSAHIDTLILGCTHYPFLKEVVRKVLGDDVRLIDPAKETVAALQTYLAAHPALEQKLPKNGQEKYFVSDKTETFERIASRWLGKKVELQKAVAG